MIEYRDDDSPVVPVQSILNDHATEINDHFRVLESLSKTDRSLMDTDQAIIRYAKSLDKKIGGLWVLSTVNAAVAIVALFT